jgi:alpha-aminoadipic semialdehyde synthase
MAVDILPTSIPLDASMHFSRVMVPYLKALIREYRSQLSRANDDIGKWKTLDRATIARNGKLVGKHAWLLDEVNKWRSSSVAAHSSSDVVRRQKFDGTKSKKKVVMLGSGMVAGPALNALCERGDIEVVVGS